MSLEAWLAFCATETVLCFTPGPAVLFVTSVAMARGMRAGLAGALGILAGNLQAANPKALVFFVALLPQFIDPEKAVGFQLLVLGASSLVIECGVLVLYAALAARARAVAGERWSGPLERVGGGFLVAAAARLALVRSQ